MVENWKSDSAYEKSRPTIHRHRKVPSRWPWTFFVQLFCYSIDKVAVFVCFSTSTTVSDASSTSFMRLWCLILIFMDLLWLLFSLMILAFFQWYILLSVKIPIPIHCVLVYVAEPATLGHVHVSDVCSSLRVLFILLICIIILRFFILYMSHDFYNSTVLQD